MNEAPRMQATTKKLLFIGYDGVKILSLFLACVLLIVALFSIVSMILLAEFGFYTGTFEATQREVYTHLGKAMAESTVWEAYREVFDPTDLTYEKMDEYDARITAETLRRLGEDNVLLTISDPGGHVIASNYRGEEPQYEGETSIMILHEDGYVERFVRFVIPVEKEGAGLFYVMDLWLAQVYGQRFAMIVIGILSFISFILLFVLLLSMAGRRAGERTAHPNVFDRLPTDLMLVLYGLYAWGLTKLILMVTASWEPVLIIPCTLLILITSPLFMLLCMSFATRCKCSTLLKNTLCFWLLRYVGRALRWLWVHALCPLGRTIHSVIAGMPIVWIR